MRGFAVDAAPVEYPLGRPLEVLQRLWQVDHRIERLSRQMERDAGLSLPQRFIVDCVRRFPGVTAGQLSSLMHLDPGTVSSALSRLEQKRLLQRRPDARDNRRVTLWLTGAGRAVGARPKVKTAERALERLVAAVAPADLDTTLAVLERLAGLLGEEAAGPARGRSKANRSG